MSKIKCQCGHENPEGTQLCEACGRPLSEEAKKSDIVDMRYEGSARRSKTYTTSIVDKVWNFFSSVTVGVWIIVILLVTSAIGTLLPQRFNIDVPPNIEAQVAEYYEKHYGIFGKVYYTLGLDNMYSSWWFKILVGMLGVSIIIASVDRVVPLYKSLKRQRTRRHASFMKRQRLFGAGPVDDPDESIEQASEAFKKLKYNVKIENDAMLAEKNRFSRWGPYVNHTGLIIFLVGVLLRGLPGWYVDEAMWLREGERKSIPGAQGYYLESKGFTLENYDVEGEDKVFEDAIERAGSVVKNYQTDVVLYKDKEGALPGSEDLEKVKEYEIVVNKPLTFDGYSIFQMEYRLDELSGMTFALVNKDSTDSLGEFTIDLTAPERKYELGEGTYVQILDYFPDFIGTRNGKMELDTATPVPNNPAFIFKLVTPETPEGETSLVEIGKPALEIDVTDKGTLDIVENDYQVKFLAADTHDMSGLTIRKDKTLYLLLVGGIIFMIGVAQGSYWQHRRVWIQKDEKTGELLLAGHTNKNWFSLRKDIDEVAETVPLPSYEDRADQEDKKEKKGDDN